MSIPILYSTVVFEYYCYLLDEQDFCVAEPPSCANSGACVELAETFRCDCAAGFTGTTCGKNEHLMMVNLKLANCCRRCLI